MRFTWFHPKPATTATATTATATDRADGAAPGSGLCEAGSGGEAEVGRVGEACREDTL